MDDIATAFEQYHAESKSAHAAIKAELSQLKEDLSVNTREIRAFKQRGAEAAFDNMTGIIAKTASDDLLNFLRTGQMESRAMSGAVGSDGGYTINNQLDQTISNMLVSVSPIRAISRVVPISSGGDFKVPIGRRGATSAWVSETEDRPLTDTPVLGMVTPPGGELMALADISSWLLDDTQFDMDAWMRQNIVDELAVREGEAFVSGNGVKKPHGFLAGTPVSTGDTTRAFGVLQYVPSGSASAIDDMDRLVDLAYALRAPYRAGARWVMNSNTAKVLRKMKDVEGRYIWQPAAVAGQPELLLGYPVTVAEDMPDIGPNTFPVAFGNFQAGYLVVDRFGTRFVRDPYTKPGWIRNYIYRRVHGAVTDSNAIKLLKIATA